MMQFSYLFVVLFLFLCPFVFASESQAIPNENEGYHVHFLDEPEQNQLFIQKCCARGKVLSDDGTCIERNFTPPKELEEIVEGLVSNSNFSYGLIRLTTGRPKCLDPWRQFLVNISSTKVEPKFTSSLQFFTKAYPLLQKDSYFIVDPKDYCIDWLSEDIIIVQYCIPDICHFPNNHLQFQVEAVTPPGTQSRPCLLKCCPPSTVLNMTSFTCVKHDSPWQLSPLGKDDATPSTSLPVTWLTGIPSCVQNYEVYSDTYDSYYIKGDGVLVTVQNGTVSETPPGEYCFEAVLEDEVDENIMSSQMAMVCYDNEEARLMEGLFDWTIVYTTLTGISCFFLLVTCVVYGILWKELHLPGWLQFAYAFSLLLTFTLLTIAQIWTEQIYELSKGFCRALGYALHFFFLSCFFWLTSMNLDLWLSFRNTIMSGFVKVRGKRRFLDFAVFSVGFPAAITFLLLAVDSCNENSSLGFLCAMPGSGIGEKSCVFDTRQKVAQLHYFYGFVGVLLLINLIIFVCTLISLRNRERETRIAKRQSTSCDYDRLQLFTRLFLIMGIIWIFEVIAWSFEYMYGNARVQNIFIFTDCLNASQGIAVFLMFVWKKHTWKQLKKKFKCLGGKRRTARRPRPGTGYVCTVSKGQQLNKGTNASVKSSHMSSTKSSDSSQIPSNSTTISQFEFDH